MKNGFIETKLLCLKMLEHIFDNDFAHYNKDSEIIFKFEGMEGFDIIEPLLNDPHKVVQDEVSRFLSIYNPSDEILNPRNH